MVRASDCQCRSRNSAGSNPSNLRHSGIWGAADEAVLNKVQVCSFHNLNKKPSIPFLVATFAWKASVSILKMTASWAYPQSITQHAVTIFCLGVQISLKTLMFLFSHRIFKKETAWVLSSLGAHLLQVKMPIDFHNELSQIALLLYNLSAYLCSCKMNRNFEAYRKVIMLQLCNLAA
jgi:hypothetical protein